MRARKFFISLSGLIALSALAACGQKSDHDVIVAACVKDDGDKGFCECWTDALEANVQASTVSKLASAIREGKTRIEAEESLNLDEQAEILRLFPQSIMCASEE